MTRHSVKAVQAVKAAVKAQKQHKNAAKSTVVQAVKSPRAHLCAGVRTSACVCGRAGVRAHVRTRTRLHLHSLHIRAAMRSAGFTHDCTAAFTPAHTRAQLPSSFFWKERVVV
jgi:hypothetical protein